MSVSEYGELTPRELMLIVEAHNEKRQQERADMLTQAYLTAAWQRAKRMPKLEKVLESLKPKEPKRAQTPEEMLAFAKRFMKKGEEEVGRRT